MGIKNSKLKVCIWENSKVVSELNWSLTKENFRKLILSIFILLFFLLIIPSFPIARVFGPKCFYLPNGMQVILVQNQRAPLVIHSLWYKVGAADEPQGKSGIAHFLEHLMFKGSKLVPPGEFSKIITRNGGTNNAFTSQDYTAYVQKIAREKLAIVMKLEADRMKNLTFTDKMFSIEKSVVMEERRSRIENNPTSLLYEAARAALFLNHPYKNPVIGWKHEIEELTKNDALQFYYKFYNPNNAILIIAGDIEEKKVRFLVRKYFGVIPRGQEVVRNRIKEPPHLAARRIQMASNQFAHPSFFQMFLAPNYRAPNEKIAYASEVLVEILGGGRTSRLHQSLVLDKKIALSLDAWYGPDSLDIGTFGISGTPKLGISLSTLENAVKSEIYELIRNGVTEEEVKRAKNSLISSITYAKDSLSSIPNIIGMALSTGRTISDVENWPNKIQAITVDHVNKAARVIFREERSVTAISRPKKVWNKK